MSEIASQEGQIATMTGVSAGANAQRWGGRSYVLAGLIIGLATVLRLLFIARYEIWLDESYCFSVARKSISEILSALAFDNGPPLYYILLHYWMKVFGDGPVALRSLSAAFSVATVAAVIGWNAPWFSRRARLLAGFALAITPLAIYYGQEARMWAMLAFFVLVSMIFLERGLRVGGALNWTCCAAATAFSLYSSYAAFFVLPTGYIVLLAVYLGSRDGKTFKRQLIGLVAAHAAAAALFLPWLPTFMHQPSTRAVRWISTMWQNEPNKWLIPFRSISVMTTGGAEYPVYLRHLALNPMRVAETRKNVAEGTEKRTFVRILATMPPTVTAAVMAVLAAAMLFTALRAGGPAFPWRTFLVAWMLTAFMIPYLLSFKTPVFVPGRYDLTGAVALAILCGIGLSRMPLGVRLPAVALMAALFLFTFGYMEAWPGQGRFSPKAKALSECVSKGDVVVGTSYEYGQVYYHIGAMRDDLVWIDFPRGNAKHFAWLDFDTWLYPGWGDETGNPVPKRPLWDEAKATIAEAIQRARPGGAIAVVWPGGPPPWERAMNSTLEAAIVSALQSGTLVEDEKASKPDFGIWVLRRPR